LLKQGRPLVTTPLVLLECGNAAARRPYRLRVNVLRQYLLQAGLLVEPTAREIEEAWAAYDRGDAAQAGKPVSLHFSGCFGGRRQGRLETPTKGTDPECLLHPLWTDQHPALIAASGTTLQQHPGFSVRALNPLLAIRRPAEHS